MKETLGLAFAITFFLFVVGYLINDVIIRHIAIQEELKEMEEEGLIKVDEL